MDSSVLDSSGLGNDESVRQETFHIYILSLAYGILIILILAHVVWRWQWRRIELSKFRTCVPGDSSFRCQPMRKRIRDDFSRIQALHASPNIKLINLKYDPKRFGGCIGNSAVPTHWYRMKTMDASAYFVSQNASLIDSVDTSASFSPSLQQANTVPLPTFVSRLKESGLLSSSDPTTSTSERCCELYELARHKDGAFEEALWEEFQTLLKEFQTQLTAESYHSDSTLYHGLLSTSPSTQTQSSTLRPQDSRKRAVSTEYGAVGFRKRSSLDRKTSTDPLIVASLASASSFESASIFLSEHTKLSLNVCPEDTDEWESPSKARHKKPPPLDLYPLVLHPEVGVYRGVASPTAYPETPV